MLCLWRWSIRQSALRPQCQPTVSPKRTDLNHPSTVVKQCKGIPTGKQWGRGAHSRKQSW
nr:MAG TPA: hypothetical protein [Bacteriophage sp.]